MYISASIIGSTIESKKREDTSSAVLGKISVSRSSKSLISKPSASSKWKFKSSRLLAPSIPEVFFGSGFEARREYIYRPPNKPDPNTRAPRRALKPVNLGFVRSDCFSDESLSSILFEEVVSFFWGSIALNPSSSSKALFIKRLAARSCSRALLLIELIRARD